MTTMIGMRDRLRFDVYGPTVREIQDAIGQRMTDAGASDWEYEFEACEMWEGGNMGFKVRVFAWRNR